MEFQGDGFQVDERQMFGTVRAELSDCGFGWLGYSEPKRCSTEKNTGPIPLPTSSHGEAPLHFLHSASQLKPSCLITG